MCFKRGDGRSGSDVSLGQWTDAQWAHGGEVFPAGTMVVIAKGAKPGSFDRQELGEPGTLHPVGRPDREMQFLAHEVTRQATGGVIEQEHTHSPQVDKVVIA